MVTRWSWFALGVLTLVACAGEDDAGSAPVAVASMHVAIEITPQYAVPSEGPETSLRGVLALDVARDGSVTGTIALAALQTQVSPVSGQIARGVLTLEPGSVGIAPLDSLEWQSFSIRTRGGGRLEGSAGTLAGQRLYNHGDYWEPISYSARVVVLPDITGEAVGLARYLPSGFDKLLPSDQVVVTLGEPVDELAAEELSVVADGVAVPGALTGYPLSGQVASLEFQAATFWPFQATLSVDPNRVADSSGNRLVPGPTLQIVADPGPAMANLGFESGMAGWISQGSFVEIQGAQLGVNPVEGTQQMVVGEASPMDEMVGSGTSLLAGYLDVAMDATSLSLSVAAVATLDTLTSSRAVVALHRAGGEQIVVFNAAAEQATGVPCECGERAVRIGPLVKTVDLTRYRGERLFLTAQTRPFGYDRLLLVLDDLRIQ